MFIGHTRREQMAYRRAASRRRSRTAGDGSLYLPLLGPHERIGLQRLDVGSGTPPAEWTFSPPLVVTVPHRPPARTAAHQPRRTHLAEIGVVVIGRNEGPRLEHIFKSVIDQAAGVVYVDSGSQDGSVAFARSLGVATIDLDLLVPFTAAQHKQGLARLFQVRPDAEYVQLVDGMEVVGPDVRVGWNVCVWVLSCVVCGCASVCVCPDMSFTIVCATWSGTRRCGDAESCGGDARCACRAFA